MKSPFLLTAILFLLLAAAGCNSQDDTGGEYAYVSTPQATLRDRVAAVYNKVGTVTSGQKVKVLDRSQNKRFVKVRTPDGHEGWMEQRYLVDQEVYDGFERLAKKNVHTPAQAIALARRAVNMHVEPARNADAIYQIKENAKVELLKRASTPKSGLKKQVAETNQSKDEEDSGQDARPGPPDPLEDWWLARDDQQHVGWVLGRMVDVDISLDIAQYAEGQRIVAAHVLNRVPKAKDSTETMPQYAVLLTEPKDGLPFDFNQVRIFTWNPTRNRYETAYRERLVGQLPFTVGQEDFGKEGKLPTFTLHAQEKGGTLVERKYKLNGPIVRKVVPAASTPAKKLAPEKRKSK